MLYTSNKYFGLQIIQPLWEVFVQHLNIYVTLLKCEVKNISYIRGLESEIDKCMAGLGLDKKPSQFKH